MVNRTRELIQHELEDDDFDLREAILARAEGEGWPAILSEAMEVLRDPNNKDLWRSAAAVIYWAPTDGEWPVPKMQVVAVLYDCLCEYPGFGGEGLDDAENLVWSIAIGLKGVSYGAEWDPHMDPEVRRYRAL